MKHDCEVVRDLMPLCIDDTASEKSCRIVNEHVAECGSCDQVYREMKAAVEIPAPVPGKNPEFDRAVRAMKTRRKRRTGLMILLGVVIALAVAAAGMAGYSWYFEEDVLLSDAELSLVMSSDGVGLIHASNVPRSADVMLRYIPMTHPESANGQFEVAVSIYATRHAARDKTGDVYFVTGIMDSGQLLLDDLVGGELEVYRMVLSGEDASSQVFYLAGEDEPETVSLKGACIKSPEKIDYGRTESNLRREYGIIMQFSTPAP